MYQLRCDRDPDHWPDHWHLASSERLSGDDFRKIAAATGGPPVRARKFGRIAARRALAVERIETLWNGKETTATAEVGDWVVTALTMGGVPLRDASGATNTYVVKADRFTDLYEREPGAGASAEGEIYRPRGEVEAIRLRAGFAIMAPWGDMQTAPDGWLLLNGKDVYGNQRETFAATYAIVG